MKEQCPICQADHEETDRTGPCDDCIAERDRAQNFVEKMQDPDMVGASEYRALHELLKDIAEGFDSETTGDDQLNHLDTVLDEVIGWAKSIKADIRKEIDPKAKPVETLTLDLKKTLKTFIDWHYDTDYGIGTPEARSYGKRLITRLKKEAKAD